MPSDVEMWGQFDHDPRLPSHAGMRASDRDRAVIETVLADAFAEGRLTRAEYDDRTESALASRTLGDLIPLVHDLPVTRATRSTIPDEAARHWEKARREALMGLIGVSAITWTIWAATMLGGFPWPLFPMLAAAINLIRTMVQKKDIIADETRRLEKKERKELKRREELG